MLGGWYCRTLASEQAADTGNHHNDIQLDRNLDSGTDESQNGIPNDDFDEQIDFKAQYRYLKRKLMFVLYENEFFQDVLRSSQRSLLKVSRDRSFLLDRLLQYEKPDATSSESNDTASSDDERMKSNNDGKKRKLDSAGGNSSAQKTATKKKRTAQPKQKPATVAQEENTVNYNAGSSNATADGHMTAEEVERHLQSRQSIIELVPEKAPPTVPNEMFSNEPSLDSESNDQLIEASPSIVGEDCISGDNMTIAK